MAEPQYQYVKLPDGSYGKFDATADDAFISGQIAKDFPDAYKQEQKPAAIRFATKFGQQYDAALKNPMGIGSDVLPAAKLDEKGNLLPQSQQTKADTGQTFGGMGREIVNFGKGIIPVDEIRQGDYAGAAGKASANILMGLSGRRAVQGGEVPTAPSETLLSESKPALTPEGQARKLTRAINPVEQVRPQMMENLAHHAGNVIEYASKNDIPLNNPSSFAKAARGAAEEAKTFFNDELLKPIENERVDTTSVGQGEVITGGASRMQMTLGEINKRVATINKMLSPDYQKKTQAGVMNALANEADLHQEAFRLNDILYKEIGSRTGLAPEQVKYVRQRYGALYNIADETQAAVNARERGADVTAEGRGPMPLARAAIVAHAVAKALNLSPENIATRRIIKAIADVDIPSEPLPEIKPPLRFNLGGNR